MLPYEFSTLEKVLEDSIDHADEMMCSICYVYAVGKGLKYSSRKNEENWMYFRHLYFAIYPSAMQNGILNEVKMQELPQALGHTDLNTHGTQIWNHCESPTRELSYER